MASKHTAMTWNADDSQYCRVAQSDTRGSPGTSHITGLHRIMQREGHGVTCNPIIDTSRGMLSLEVFSSKYLAKPWYVENKCHVNSQFGRSCL